MRAKAAFIAGLGFAIVACGSTPPPAPEGASPGSSSQEITMPPPPAAPARARPATPSRIVLRDIATDQTDRTSESDAEPSIAVNPLNPNEIAVVAFSGNWGPDGGPAAPVWKSFDGGQTWEKLPLIPPPSGIAVGPPNNRPVTLMGPADQSVAYDTAGKLIVEKWETIVTSREIGRAHV